MICNPFSSLASKTKKSSFLVMCFLFSFSIRNAPNNYYILFSCLPFVSFFDSLPIYCLFVLLELCTSHYPSIYLSCLPTSSTNHRDPTYASNFTFTRIFAPSSSFLTTNPGWVSWAIALILKWLHTYIKSIFHSLPSLNVKKLMGP